MTKTEDYNINLTPNEAMDIDEPMPVNIDIYLDDIFSIETTGTLITRVRLVERWVDPRLSISGERSDVRVEVVEPIWHPEGRFKHNADTHTKWDVTYLVNKGQVVKITEMTLNIYCQFDFTWFPWDWQECALIYYDATYGEDQVMFKTGNYKIHSEVNLPQWEIIKEIYEEMPTETDSGPSAAAVNANFVI